MTEQPWSCTVTCKPAGIDIPQTRQDTGRTSHSVLFPESSVNHPVNCESHSPLWLTPFCHRSEPPRESWRLNFLRKR
ncbi:hypothetical protein CDL32_24995 [Escherichia coli]|nr:hypothetical protein CDL32_24995 [Escherichia coli]